MYIKNVFHVLYIYLHDVHNVHICDIIQLCIYILRFSYIYMIVACNNQHYDAKTMFPRKMVFHWNEILFFRKLLLNVCMF